MQSLLQDSSNACHRPEPQACGCDSPSGLPSCRAACTSRLPAAGLASPTPFWLRMQAAAGRRPSCSRALGPAQPWLRERPRRALGSALCRLVERPDSRKNWNSVGTCSRGRGACGLLRADLPAWRPACAVGLDGLTLQRASSPQHAGSRPLLPAARARRKHTHTRAHTRTPPGRLCSPRSLRLFGSGRARMGTRRSVSAGSVPAPRRGAICQCHE